MTKPRIPTDIHRGTEYDLEPIVALLTDAFMTTPIGRWLIPDDHRRPEILPGYFRIVVEHALRDRTAIVDLSPDADAVAVWLSLYHNAAVIPHYDDHLAHAVGQANLARFKALDRIRDAQHPAEQWHHQLALFAVHPDRQRHGLGTALLQHHHQVLDAGGLPAYVEATDPSIAALLHRHGYQSRPAIRIPDGGPDLYPLWRPPGTTR